MNSVEARTKFILPAIGSKITHASASPFSLNNVCNASTSLYGKTSVSLDTACGTPAEDGLPNVSKPEPALTKRLSECPW